MLSKKHFSYLNKRHLRIEINLLLINIFLSVYPRIILLSTIDAEMINSFFKKKTKKIGSKKRLLLKVYLARVETREARILKNLTWKSDIPSVEVK